MATSRESRASAKKNMRSRWYGRRGTNNGQFAGAASYDSMRNKILFLKVTFVACTTANRATTKAPQDGKGIIALVAVIPEDP